MRRLLAAALVALALLGAPRADGAAPADSRLGDVQRVLDARAAAVLKGDKQAFLDTVDPKAPAEFKEAQGRLFDGLHSVPLASYTLTARLDDTGDLSTATRSRYDAPTFLPETRQRMRLKDFDAVDAVDPLYLTFVQRDGRWLVAADNDLSLLGIDTARGLWDFGPVVAHPTAHFLVLSHPAESPRAKALGDIAEEAVGVLGQRWTLPWPGRIPVVLPSNATELGAIIQATVDVEKFVAFVSYSSVRDTSYEVTAPRVYIQDANLAKYGHQFQVETLVHELVHAASAPLAGPFIPAWVHEGVADWVATGRRTDEKRPGGAGPHLPRDYEFTTGDQGSIVRSYNSSRAAVSALSSAKGLAAPLEFIKALGAVRQAPGSADYQTDQALRQATGLGMADLESLWGR